MLPNFSLLLNHRKRRSPSKLWDSTNLASLLKCIVQNKNNKNKNVSWYSHLMIVHNAFMIKITKRQTKRGKKLQECITMSRTCSMQCTARNRLLIVWFTDIYMHFITQMFSNDTNQCKIIHLRIRSPHASMRLFPYPRLLAD